MQGRFRTFSFILTWQSQKSTHFITQKEKVGAFFFPVHGIRRSPLYMHALYKCIRPPCASAYLLFIYAYHIHCPKRRRGHAQYAGSRPQLAGGTKPAAPNPPNASRSSGEGVWGRGASLREAASSPESPPKASFREGARGRGLFFRKGPSLAITIIHSIIYHRFAACDGRRDSQPRSAAEPTLITPFPLVVVP